MIEMASLAKSQSSITGDSFEDWHKSIEWAATATSLSNLTDGEFVFLIKQAHSQATYQTVVELLEQYEALKTEDSGHDLLVRFVDDSSFSMREWMAALHQMSQWLKARGQSADLARSLGYIKCCTQSAGGSEVDLPSYVVDMLDQFGLEEKP